ncbi:MAG TPA: C25 family cysteine peptidase, partial [Blastocatellia bacterium]|nr:C25 family cysteine peptidase [Blastocatellia bacterium]
AQKVGGVPAQYSTASVLSRKGKGEPKTRQLSSSSHSPGSRSQRQTATAWDLPSQPTIKLSIRDEGWYRVTQPELIAAGLDPKTDPRTLQMYAGGQERAVLVVGEQDGAFDQTDAIEFYATGQDLPSTDTHTYWLAGGKQRGKRISSESSDPEPGGARSFAYTLERKDKTIYFSSLRNGDAENFFGPVIASQPVNQELTLQHLDASAPGEALLEIALQGVTDVPGIGPDHQVKVMLNGAQAGRLMFNGRQHSIERISVPHHLLREGVNVVTLIAEGGLSDVTLIDYVRVTYWHAYTADQDELRMTVPEQSGPQTVGGFSNGSIRVLDITDGGEPQELIGRIERQKDGRFAVTVDVAGDAERTLIAFTEDRVNAPVSTAANQLSFWRDPSHAADLLIITHRDFARSLAPLKALRESQGFDVEVVDIEDVYDEFSFGEKRPEAVREFLSLISGAWKKAPRFVLFVGDASFDARNYLGAGDSDFVPTKLIDTAYLETASDDWFADFNDDGLAEMFVGRLPVRTASEAAALVSKLVGYDSADGKSVGGRTVLLVADKNDGFNFELASEQLRSFVPLGVGVQEIFRGRMDDAAAKKQLIEAINGGKSIVNYIGHGSSNVWR